MNTTFSRAGLAVIALTVLALVCASIGVAAPAHHQSSAALSSERFPGLAEATKPDADLCSPVSGVTCVLDIPYIDDGTAAHTLDVYYPTNLTDRASVVLIHGGFWKSGTSSLFAPEAQYLAENGFVAFSINYKRSRPGEPSWPQVRTDAEAATAWVMHHADEYHGDNVRVGMLGGSAGGHLAALVDTAGPEDGIAPIATVAWSGPMDLTITYNKGNGAAKHNLAQLLGCTPDQCPQTYAASSPVSHVTRGDGTMLFFQSSDERVPVAGAREMNQALAAAGVPHTLVVLKHSTQHARQYECDQVRVHGATLPVIDDSVRWLGSQLSQPTTPTGTFCAGATISSSVSDARWP